MGSCPCIQITLWSRGLVKSCDKLKLLYLHYQSAYGKVAIFLDELLSVKLHHLLITWYCVINLKLLYLHYNIFMATNLGRLVIYHQRLLPIMLLQHLVTWPCEITWQTENICWLPECVWPQNVTGWWLHDCIIMWSLRSRDTVK